MDDKNKLYQLFVVVVMLVLLTGGILVGFAFSKKDIAVSNTDKDEQVQDVSNKDIEIYNNKYEKEKKDVEIVYVDIYNDCNHTTEKRRNEYGVDIEDVKKRELDKIEKEHSEYRLVKSSDTLLMFEKVYSSKCSNHYILKLDNDKVVIYRYSDEKYDKYQETDITKESIRPDLAFRLEEGIEAETVEELYMFLEELES